MAILFNNYYFSNKQLIGYNDCLKKLPKLINLRTCSTEINDTIIMHTHNLLEVFYFYEGSGFFKTATQEIAVEPHTFIAVNANTPHCNYTVGKNLSLKFHSLFIDDVQLENLPPNCLSNEEIEVYKFTNANNGFYKYLTRILSEFAERKYASQNKIQSIFLEFIVDTIRLYQKTNNKNNNTDVPDYIKKAKDYIDRNFLEDITLSYLSKMFFVSKEYLCKKFTAVYGMSPIKYLSIVRIEQSKLLLETSNSPISEIAISCGFNNPAYFSEQFKKLVGETPKSYMKKFKSNI